MKILHLISILIISLTAFGQQKKNVFGYNEKTDQIVYRTSNNKKEISGFNILLDKKTKFFSASPYRGKPILKINTSRQDLAEKVKKDNLNNQTCYIIYVKSINKFFIVDHIVRKTQN
ncbi:hypothetical protein [Flavobacterium sp. HJSW_4]|uniref:hypothetical protein n=1 Tax=Flavobacterium sp. HJSW_4 TaxID=3344660 RepID=UPI0035F35AEC